MRLWYIAVERSAFHSKIEYQVSFTRFYLCLYPLENFLNNCWCIQCCNFVLEFFSVSFFKIECVSLELVYFHSNSYQKNLIGDLNWFECLTIENLLYLYLKYIWSQTLLRNAFLSTLNIPFNTLINQLRKQRLHLWRKQASDCSLNATYNELHQKAQKYCYSQVRHNWLKIVVRRLKLALKS